MALTKKGGRPLTKREKNLAVLTGAVFFLITNVLVITLLVRKQGELRDHVAELREERAEADMWLKEMETWLERKQWLEKTQPVLKSPSVESAQLLEALSNSAARHSITIVEQGFAEPEAKGAGSTAEKPRDEIDVKLKVSGPMEAVTRWLAEIQRPETLQGVNALSMKVDGDPSKIVCELTVVKYYAPAP